MAFDSNVKCLVCFNPRPPFPGGDAKLHLTFGLPRLVSIHAPRFREAMPFPSDANYTLTAAVSIHAPRFREAMQETDTV